jgi:hypothetical protein
MTDEYIKVKKISSEEYLELFNKLKACIRPTINLSPLYDKQECLKAVEEALNPPLPMFIDWYEVEGVVRYVSDKTVTD